MSVAYLIAGSGGMLGTALQARIADRGERCVAPAERDLDITDPEAVEQAVSSFATGLTQGERGVLVNAAAYTNVERAEDDVQTAYLVNETGAAYLAKAACRHGLRFVHVSTDFVFDGTKAGAYFETDEAGPLSVYGASKLAGERAVADACPDAITVRTAWVFGPGGVNFPVKIASAARERGALTVVDDEMGSPTYTFDLADGILGLVAVDAAAGVYHLAGQGSTSRFEMALEVLRLAGIDVPVARAKSADFPSKAARPLNSVLDCGKAARLGVWMPDWRDALARFIASSEL